MVCKIVKIRGEDLAGCGLEEEEEVEEG